MTAPFIDRLQHWESRSASLPETAQWLIQGGDQRIALDPVTGRNRYGCLPEPEPDLLALGSSTASVISEAGYRASERLRQRLSASPIALPTACAREGRRQSRELIQLLGLEDCPPRVILGASGTDLHHQAALLAGNGAGRLGSVMVEDAETGRDVGKALTGAGREVRRLRLREENGLPREQARVDAEAAAAVAAVLEHQDHCLLVMTDLSKTGLIAPSPALAASLQADHAGRVTVLVDACQMRLATPTLRQYLSQGFWVVMTGSKFLGGPTFSGALLLPESTTDTPVDALGVTLQPGLLLRWEAALEELRAFAALDAITVEQTLSGFARCASEQIETLKHLSPLASHKIHRDAASWDAEQTIFPFVPIMADGSPLPLNLTKDLYHGMLSPYPEWERTGASLRVQLGQPVACGYRRGQPAHALRLCASARLVVQAAREGLTPLLDQLQAALEKVDWMAGRLSQT